MQIRQVAYKVVNCSASLTPNPSFGEVNSCILSDTLDRPLWSVFYLQENLAAFVPDGSRIIIANEKELNSGKPVNVKRSPSLSLKLPGEQLM